jgi:demethylmenaquinone methyltransferase/2-methoxy-6-polyprenyl-1,4-benzoquinol methylase
MTKDSMTGRVTDPQRSTSKAETELAALDLDTHLRDPSIKQRFVTVMFDVIARRYDRFTRVFSFGMDAGWKRQLMSGLDPDTRARVVVDLACGTGDFATQAGERWPEATVLGLDVSHRMIALAAKHSVRNGRVSFAVGDMIDLPLPDHSVDVITVGYGIRNAPTPAQALREIARVLRPGALLLVLDFYRPHLPVWRSLFPWYLRIAGNLVGWLWHREPVAYGYIGPSVAGYLEARQFEEAMSAHGFTVQRAQRKLLGGIALHVAVRQ